ncbi:formiminotransferase N-terminal subdomain-containing protein [Electrophorus electricus]|uniref:Formiminotransferase N-terminal subdomain domain-containing protein n=2 Tax=Electrophorus TaxID=8004 RepID=A0A4W4DVI7_ELEEL|nr:formiminotransferase N-terminal subdomain-containing protein [Electrophorus electricus]XP_026862603.1 formiminotransferase N-terminal subdomain-containing protein [Electrophorus electricus]XP_026862604.1 formiminotransferase N-terminal subdomain-containing protein [Electrophorus electricus]XP_026862605.1 formiminotransferase N-terminal subdomain-containing protein [Electrophorus electricus]XP_035378738.1 formiminotransferase N-terminal subdomain-containing protein [Electrophorus electricus]
MAFALGRRLVTCLLNVSEARQKDLVEKVAQAAITDQHGGRRKDTTILNIFSDYDYNRSVITIVANIELIREAVLAACERACELIDMNAHGGVHPAMGAVDLVPLYPLGEDVGLEECGKEARALATALTERVLGTSVFLFGWADVPLHRGLAQRRKELGWFRKVPSIAAVLPDVGPQPTRRYGITGVGASPYVMTCNVTMDTQDLTIGRDVAAAIRESSPGGIPGVQVIALPHEGTVEIACNVESVGERPSPGLAAGMEPWPEFSIGDQTFCHAPASLIAAYVKRLAGHHGVVTKGTALVGFTPQKCKALAEQALTQGIREFWKELQSVQM